MKRREIAQEIEESIKSNICRSAIECSTITVLKVEFIIEKIDEATLYEF